MVTDLYNLEFCKKLAISKHGECLTSKYMNVDTKIHWRCARGHEFRRSLRAVKTLELWCETCAKADQLSLCNQEAMRRGGLCLSQEFVKSKSKLLWRCALGHEWEAPWARIQRGGWCRRCHSKSLTAGQIEKCRSHAEKLAGKFLSDTYENSNVKYLWECSEGHQWLAKWSNVSQGKWCPDCAGRRQTIDDLIKFAKTKNGECLSDRYNTHDAKYRWRCSEGHEWSSSWGSIKHNGSWCPECSNSFAYLGEEGRLAKYQTVVEEIKNRGGKTHSPSYLGRGMDFECSEGHRFNQRPDQMLKGRWCHECGGTRAEKLVRIAFETIFSGFNFPNVRPEILRSNSGYKLELDGFCTELSLAFEHDGIQHFKATSKFSAGQQGLAEIKKRDVEKERLCKENQITLIRIAYDAEFENLPQLIRESIPAERIDLLDFNFDVIPDYSRAYLPDDPLAIFRDIAKAKGGRVLSNTLAHGDAYIELECANKHRWKARAETVKNRDYWCKKCGHMYRKQTKSSITWEDVQEIRRIAATNDFVLKELGEKYNVHVNSIRRIIQKKTRKYS